MATKLIHDVIRTTAIVSVFTEEFKEYRKIVQVRVASDFDNPLEAEELARDLAEKFPGHRFSVEKGYVKY